MINNKSMMLITLKLASLLYLFPYSSMGSPTTSSKLTQPSDERLYEAWKQRKNVWEKHQDELRSLKVKASLHRNINSQKQAKN